MFGADQSGSSAGSGSSPRHVEERGAEVARLQRRDQRGLVDQRAPTDVAEQRARLHRRERGGVEQALGLGGSRARSTTTASQRAEHVVEVGGAAQLVDRGVVLAFLVAAAGADQVHAERARPVTATAVPMAPSPMTPSVSPSTVRPNLGFHVVSRLLRRRSRAGASTPTAAGSSRTRRSGAAATPAALVMVTSSGSPASCEVVDAGADGLHPAQVRRRRSATGAGRSRASRTSARAHTARVSSVSSSSCVGQVVGEAAEVRLRHDLELGEALP